MTTADKILRAKEDLDAAYEAGKATGIDYDTLWDGLQNNGTRGNYTGFADTTPHNGWFKPKYDIKPTTAESFMRNYGSNLKATEYIDLPALLDECGITMDFSKCANVTYLFYSARIWHLPVIDLTGAGDNNTNQLIFGAYTKKIDKVVVKETQNLAKPFTYATALEEIEFDGTIGKALGMSKCTKLTAESYNSIMTHCSKTASFTLSLPAEATVRSIYDAKYGAGAWDAITAEYSNVTIAYN